MRSGVRFRQDVVERLCFGYVHHEVERLAEFRSDLRLIDDAGISFCAKILNVVAEMDLRG